ncbi:uncharacterized protein SCHCODRAFT_02669476 [Schizophyllum commune H4-8]|uniref:Uncharacterized protein n=1 Tax=Schizophyllum commune (strain H4-8 / FGSC 9210) TaxID=578458 RepID=D8Q9R4_SCHCM|nr:uncharacterized protein SCHCODRAFT_02669476 [Schizophyllum commune H4-8]KAI5890315.1 hypothetical protein SCHCODRAFT_02669476 [Schizophyllum commune H4-8]
MTRRFDNTIFGRHALRDQQDHEKLVHIIAPALTCLKRTAPLRQEESQTQVEEPLGLIVRAERRKCMLPRTAISRYTPQERDAHPNRVLLTPQIRRIRRKAMVECKESTKATHALTFATPHLSTATDNRLLSLRQSSHKRLLIKMSSYNKINKNTVHNAGHPQATHAPDHARRLMVVGGKAGPQTMWDLLALRRGAFLRAVDAQDAQGPGTIRDQGGLRPTSATSTNSSVTLFGDESVEWIMKEVYGSGYLKQPKQRRPTAKTLRIADNHRFRYSKHTKAPKASDVPPLEEMIRAHVTDKNVTASRQAAMQPELVADNAVKDFAFLASKARQGRGQQSGEENEGLSSMQLVLRGLQKGPVKQDQLKARSQRCLGVPPSQSVRAKMPMGITKERALVPFQFPPHCNYTNEPANAVGSVEQAASDASPSSLELPASYYEYEADEAYKTRVNKGANMRAPSPSELPAPTDYVAEDARRAIEAMMPPRSYDLPRCPRARQRFVLYSTLQALPGSPE